MTVKTQRERLQVQLLDTERMLDLADDHPLMSVSFREKKKELEAQIEKLPLGSKEASAILLFSGAPVQGSMGIDVSFAGNVLMPFQNMVMADYADRYHGSVAGRGRRRGEKESRLLLTALPRGSFGMELKKAEEDELFEESQLEDTLAHVTELVDAAATSDEEFALKINDTAPRVIQNLKQFLEAISNGKAGLKLETGDYSCEMNPDRAASAFDRVSRTVSTMKKITLKGVFKGALLESWKFDFMDENNHKISGKLADDLSEDAAASLNRDYTNISCVATLEKTVVIFKNGRERTTYVLQSLEQPTSS